MKTSLTFKQKQTLYDEYLRRRRNEEDLSQHSLALWAREQFSLPQTPHQTTISRILSSQARLPKLRSHRINKRDRTGNNHTLEQALYGWVCHQYSSGRTITGALIRSKCLAIQTALNERLPSSLQFEMKFSAGWLSRFQTRWGLTGRTAKGGDADSGDDTETKIAKLKSSLRNYSIDDIWSADELGLFYNMVPNKRIARYQLADRKKERAKLTVLACCNATGKEKFPLMFIGEAMTPCCLNKETGKQLALDYHYNLNAWMTSSLFFDWLHRFDEYIGRTNDRKVVLLIDSCSAHGTGNTIPQLQSVRVIFLPAHALKVQPLDAGVIPTMKILYRQRQMERAMDMTDCEQRDIHKLDLHTSMKWLTELWEGMSEKTIETCWRYTGIIDDGLASSSFSLSEVERSKQVIEGYMKELVGDRDRMNIDEFINPVGEDVVTEQVSDEGMVKEILGTLLNHGNEDEECDEVVPFPGINEQLRALAIVKLYTEQNKPDEKDFIRRLQDMQRELRTQKKAQDV